jgi:hypothetical protein
LIQQIPIFPGMSMIVVLRLCVVFYMFVFKIISKIFNIVEACQTCVPRLSARVRTKYFLAIFFIFFPLGYPPNSVHGEFPPWEKK